MAFKEIWLTPSEIADTYAVTIEAVYKWIKRGKLKAYQLGGRNGSWRIRKSDLENFIQENELSEQ